MKKINQKGIGHHLLLIVLAVLVVGAAGFAGWRVYHGRQLDAQAGAIPYFGTVSTSINYSTGRKTYTTKIYACKTMISQTKYRITVRYVRSEKSQWTSWMYMDAYGYDGGPGVSKEVTGGFSKDWTPAGNDVTTTGQVSYGSLSQSKVKVALGHTDHETKQKYLSEILRCP